MTSILGDELRTSRLRLRRVAESDRAVMIAVHSDPRTSVHFPSGPTPPALADAQFDQWLRDWAERGYGYWAIEVADTGELIGFGGLRYRERGDQTYLNLAYRLDPSAWGRGYATEMAVAAVDWARRALPDLAVMVVTDLTNVAAARVAEKLGFVELPRGDYDGVEVRFFRSTHPRD